MVQSKIEEIFKANKLDHEVLSKAEFAPWDDENEFMDQLAYMRDFNIEDADRVNDAIRALEIIKLKLTAWVNENITALEPKETAFMMNIYEKHLALLKGHEGVDFERALISYKTCLRVFQFIMAALYDYPDRIFGFIDLPEEVRRVV